MPRIELSTRINASIQTVFDLSRSIDLHVESTLQTNEKAVAGRTSGLISMGEEVTWEATHFGVRQRLTSRIVAFEPPRYFRDSMVAGIFKRFDHDHFFEPEEENTLMVDIFDFTAPLGMLGRVADVLFLERYLRNLLQTRNQFIKSVAETGRSSVRC
ncbi:SRPBCC family protein [Bythopirellula polymerisocia]|uniref:Polyketide cyclase / dehydrase and lipid transport n=1 Tax=Bythopirellula polymerisocia TaxID=2528003 RepID=A0A5C6CVB8_9BACT|nr:SRPBCC family protein [Bythopirellula polymerisocia]TWU28530.1 hypothetical protein Pla144_18200 [Bythopirellula polymerisocia]